MSVRSDRREVRPARPRLTHNWLSLCGLAVVILCVAVGLIVLVADAVLGQEVPYLGILLAVLLAIGACGALIIALGGVLQWLRIRKGRPLRPPLPLRLDLNQRRDRTIALSLLLGLVVVVVAFGFAANQAVEHIQSPQFCAFACHQVMEPEATTYPLFPHAHVACVECHVGAGMGPYVAARLNGLRQLVSYLTDDYSRPIPTPVENLPTARETCEGCHWRYRYIGLKEKVYTYYQTDRRNTRHMLRMLMDVGGTKGGEAVGHGIHYHMLIAGSIEFIARDEGKQEIAWVRLTDREGNVRIFEDDWEPLTDEERRTLPVHEMTCTDCHNRPAHRFLDPMTAMNAALEAGRIDAALPFIKRLGVEALSRDYATTEEALAGIEETITDAYGRVAAELLGTEAVRAAVGEVQQVLRHTIFPGMGVRWSVYPNNLGHRDFPGCFRCHNDVLVSEGDETIFTTCSKCHLILAQGEDVYRFTADLELGEVYHHFGDGEVMAEYVECVDCHTGGADTY